MKRVLAHLLFWPLIAVDIAVSAVVVLLVYLPMVGLKAVRAAVRGDLRAGSARSGSSPART